MFTGLAADNIYQMTNKILKPCFQYKMIIANIQMDRFPRDQFSPQIIAEDSKRLLVGNTFLKVYSSVISITKGRGL